MAKTVQREKKTKSGPLLELDFYPVFSDGRAVPYRKPKSRPTTAEMMKYNRTVAMKKLVRLVNANFGPDDYFLHPTYSPKNAPQNEAAARRDIVNYLRRVKTRRAAEARRVRAELSEAKIAAAGGSRYGARRAAALAAQLVKLEEPMRYIYVIERQVYQRGPYAGLVNWHFHLFVTGGLDDRTMEKTWPHGVRVNCDNYQPDRFGPEAAALYVSKDPQGSRRFVYSRNLKKPEEKIRDGRVSGRAVELMATQRVDDAAFWEARYPGYRFLRCYARFNEYNRNWYVSAVMYRTAADPPPWKEEEWLT